MRLTGISILIIVAFFSCNSDSDYIPLQFKSEYLTIETGGTLLANPGYTQLIATDTNEILLTYNGFERRFQFLTLPDAELTHEIYLEKEGEHGINMFRGFKYTNTDSIWFINNPPAIGLLDFEGRVTIRKKIMDDQTPLQILRAYPDKQLYERGNRIFGAQPLFMDHHGMDKKDINKFRLVFSYDFQTDSVEWYEVYYSANYWDKGKKVTDYSWTEREGKLYIAPWYDHEIQVFDMDLCRVTERKEVRSRHVNKFLFVNRLPRGPDEGIVSYFTNDQYGSILYDKYRDIFYRLFIPSFDLNDLEEEYNYRELMISRPYLGVMVLDKDLNVIGEHVFDKFEIYTLRNHFVGKKGLYLSLNNLFHPDYDEDHFRYLIFTPELDKN